MVCHFIQLYCIIVDSSSHTCSLEEESRWRGERLCCHSQAVTQSYFQVHTHHHWMRSLVGGSEHSVSVKMDVCRGRSCSHMAVCGMDGMQGQLLAKRQLWVEGVGP